jgi:hypothetical protein
MMPSAPPTWVCAGWKRRYAVTKVLELREKLLEAHRRLLLASAITIKVIVARGYRTVTDARELRRLGFSPKQTQCAPGVLIPIHGVGGRIVTHQFRPDAPRLNKDGKPIKYETPAGSRLVLDVPPMAREAIGNPAVPLFITEGSRKADAAVSKGLCCIALLGVWGFRGRNKGGGTVALADWESIALNDRTVYVAFDSDVMQKREVHAALVRLKALLESRGARVRIIYLPPGPDGAKIGIDDFFATGHTVDELRALATDTLRPPTTPLDHGAGGKSYAQRLVAIAEQEADLFHTPNGEPYATFRVREQERTLPIGDKASGSAGFEEWLVYRFHSKFGTPPPRQAVEDALRVLQAKARFEGPEHPVYLRTAEHEGRLYLFLANEAWQAIEIAADGWRIVDSAPVRFTRLPNTAPLPIPERGGSLNAGSTDDFRLLVGWTIGALYAGRSYSILVLHGEQGSGKTTALEVLRSLIDPVAVSPTCALPDSRRDLAIAARNTHVLAFANISSIAAATSDALCRLATGAGLVTRKLYTDYDQVVFGGARPIAVDGIVEFGARPDLLDRAIVLTFPRIDERKRQDERAFWARYEAARPRILGALLDALVVGVRTRPTLKRRELTRMADFETTRHASLTPRGGARAR